VTARSLIVALALLLAGCAHRTPPSSATLPAPTAKDLPRPDAIPGAFAVRQKLNARSAHGGGGFEAVLQKKPGEVLLVGLTPFGSRAFLLRQTDADVQFTSYISRELPFPPTYMLLDVHRVMDVWLPGPPPADGERAAQVGAERVRERWRAGKLVERVFSPADPAAKPPGDVTISYEGEGPAGLAAHVKLVNARFGYDLSIDSFQLR
jgi:hypothetical protein